MKTMLSLTLLLFHVILTTTAQDTKPAKEVAVELGKGIMLELVLVPAGQFIMGSPLTEPDREDDENQNKVVITKPFYLGKFEVTQEQWMVVMGKNPSNTKGEKLPVTNVSWDDCQEFINKLNSMNKGRFRLPSEAEWEYACRAGSTTTFSFGDKITPKDANFSRSKLNKTTPVGSYKPNAFGLYDMHGNVVEWCNDWYAKYPKEEVKDPQGPINGSSKILRGGSFSFLFTTVVRAADRFHFTPTYESYSAGLRLVREN